MAKVDTSDNMNQGLPENTGLDATVKARLRRQLEGPSGGIKVGSFRDLQLGLTDTSVEERPTNPNQPDEDLISVAENDAAAGIETQATQDEGLEISGSSSEYDAMTKDELMAELDNQGIAYSSSETKAELRAKLG